MNDGHVLHSQNRCLDIFVAAAHCRDPKELDILQVMLWQRKIELEREMNDVLDPTVGGDVVGAMKKEIHRMQLRAAELSRIQESLLLDLERSITKRDTIALKVNWNHACS